MVFSRSIYFVLSKYYFWNYKKYNGLVGFCQTIICQDTCHIEFLSVQRAEKDIQMKFPLRKTFTPKELSYNTWYFWWFRMKPMSFHPSLPTHSIIPQTIMSRENQLYHRVDWRRLPVRRESVLIASQRVRTCHTGSASLKWRRVRITITGKEVGFISSKYSGKQMLFFVLVMR